MNRIRELLIFALCILLALAPAVSANSGPMSWEGAVGVGSLVVDESSPIVVEKEVLSFDIQQFPVEYYGTASALEGYYGATVTAEYTFRNPTAADVTATLLFPYGRMPDYVNVYAEEHPRAMEFMESLCGVWAGDQALEVTRRASLHDPGEKFNITDAEQLHGTYMDHEFYNPDQIVTKYLYEVSGVDYETYYAADWGAELRSDPARRKILIRDADGWGTKVDYVLIHGGLDHRNQTDKFAVYVIGEPFEQQPDWVVYENGACETIIDGTVELIHTETMTLLELATEARQERFGISVTDWYNAFVQDLIRREFSQGCIEPGVITRVDLGSMYWYQYELTVPAGETVVNTVTAPLYPDIHKGWDPAIYTYQYLLSPARGWADFGPLDIEIKTPYYMTQCNLEGFEKTGEGYFLHLDGLPEKELEFVLSEKANPRKPGTLPLIVRLLPILLICVGVVKLMWESKKKK